MRLTVQCNNTNEKPKIDTSDVHDSQDSVLLEDVDAAKIKQYHKKTNSVQVEKNTRMRNIIQGYPHRWQFLQHQYQCQTLNGKHTPNKIYVIKIEIPDQWPIELDTSLRIRTKEESFYFDKHTTRYELNFWIRKQIGQVTFNDGAYYDMGKTTIRFVECIFKHKIWLQRQMDKNDNDTSININKNTNNSDNINTSLREDYPILYLFNETEIPRKIKLDTNHNCDELKNLQNSANCGYYRVHFKFNPKYFRHCLSDTVVKKYLNYNIPGIDSVLEQDGRVTQCKNSDNYKVWMWNGFRPHFDKRLKKMQDLLSKVKDVQCVVWLVVSTVWLVNFVLNYFSADYSIKLDIYNDNQDQTTKRRHMHHSDNRESDGRYGNYYKAYKTDCVNAIEYSKNDQLYANKLNKYEIYKLSDNELYQELVEMYKMHVDDMKKRVKGWKPDLKPSMIGAEVNRIRECKAHRHMGKPLTNVYLLALILYTWSCIYQKLTKLGLRINHSSNNTQKNNVDKKACTSCKDNNENARKKEQWNRFMFIFDYCIYMAITKLDRLNGTKKSKDWKIFLCSGQKNVFWDERNDNDEIEFYKHTSFTWLPNIAAQYCKIDNENVNSVVLLMNDLENVVWSDVSWISKHQGEMEIIVRRNCRTFCKHVIKNEKRKFQIVLLGKKCQNCQEKERIEYKNCDECHISNVKCKNCHHCLNCAWSWMHK